MEDRILVIKYLIILISLVKSDLAKDLFISIENLLLLFQNSKCILDL